MTEQIVATTRGRTVIAVRYSDRALTPPFQGPVGAETARAGAFCQSTGRCGEDLATTYLEDIDWRTLEHDWRPDHNLHGELDIIALEPGHAYRESGSESVTDPAQGWTGTRLVIIEVETRSSLRQGPPAVTVDARKVVRLRALTAAQTGTHETPPHAGMRLDAVSIFMRGARPMLLRHRRAVDVSWGQLVYLL